MHAVEYSHEAQARRGEAQTQRQEHRRALCVGKRKVAKIALHYHSNQCYTSCDDAGRLHPLRTSMFYIATIQTGDQILVFARSPATATNKVEEQLKTRVCAIDLLESVFFSKLGGMAVVMPQHQESIHETRQS